MTVAAAWHAQYFTVLPGSLEKNQHLIGRALA
jgi:hypothetical protein